MNFLTEATLCLMQAILCGPQRVPVYYLRTTQCRVLGISSDGLCQLFIAVIFHRPCAQGLSEAWHEENEMGKERKGNKTFVNLFCRFTGGFVLFVAVVMSEPGVVRAAGREREPTFSH